MKISKLTCAILASLVVSGCASRASSVTPVAVSATEYTGMSCEETRAELSGARDRSVVLTRKQNTAATVDTASVILVFFPLGSVFGGDVSGELAQAKGEVGALTRAIQINCRNEAIAMSTN